MDWTTATTLRARWSTSSASKICRSSARLRSVMSAVTPLIQIRRPLSSKLAAAVPVHQRTSPFGRRTRNSVWNVLASFETLRNGPHQQLKVFRIDERADIVERRHKCARVDAEDLALALVPDVDLRATFHSQLPICPDAKRHAAQTLTLAQLQGRSGKLGGAFGNARFQFAIELFELPRLAVKLGKDLDLRAQNFRHDRHRHIVHRAHFIAAQAIDVGQMDRRNENDRGLLEARMLADHRRELKSVEVRHADVDEHDGDFVFKKELERLRGVARA